MIRGALRPLIRGGLRGVIPGVALSATAQIRQLLFGSGQQGILLYPRPVVDGEQVLWEMSDGTVIVDANGDPVGRADDLSGNDNHAVQSTSADRPLYQTDGSLHWLLPDGAGDNLELPEGVGGGLFADPSSPFSVSIAVEITGSAEASVQPILYKNLDNNERQFSIDVFDGNIRVALRSGIGSVAETEAPISDGKKIITVRYLSSGVAELFINNSTAVNLSVGPKSYNPYNVTLFSRTGAGGYWNSPFYGMIIHGADTSDEELKNIREYLASRAGITL